MKRKFFAGILLIFSIFLTSLPTISVKAEDSNFKIMPKTITSSATGNENGVYNASSKLQKWGMYPGLNIDILHKYGFTGKGVKIAYIDQPVQVEQNSQYSKKNIHYKNLTTSENSMHGSAVLSLLVGKDIGTAPDAEVYYYAHAAWKADQTTHAEALYMLIKDNEKLPKGKKITMVGFSDNIDESEKNASAFRKAVSACEKAGIMVWFCGDYGSSAFLPDSDKNNFDNLTYDFQPAGMEPKLVYVPSGSRTTAGNRATESYIYWPSGGLSWTMPYMIGLYGIAKEIDSSLTQKDICKLVVDTAYTNSSGMRIVDPVSFISAVLKKVGRSKEANAMLKEVKNRHSYTYVVYNSAEMNSDDLDSAVTYLSGLIDTTVVMVDAKNYTSAPALYNALKADNKKRGGKVDAVQIFGTTSAVPAFNLKYQALMINNELDDAGIYLSDYFYSNFDNNADKIDGEYSVYKQFSQKKITADLIPDWPVVRLPLEKGQYAKFFKNYVAFAKKTDMKKQTIVNFSNPIFASKKHIDDMGIFLDRFQKDFNIKLTYKLYGNKDGQYPVQTKVIGNFTSKNLTKVNQGGVCEYIINTHGQANNVDRCIYKNNKEIRESLVNSSNINSVLNKNYYYLDMWTCSNGYNMENNIITTALSGKCVGAFAATSIISNNGVNCNASLEDMKKSNFYYFYYNYLKEFSKGDSREIAFYKARKAYAKALVDDSKKALRGEGNYQFNINNLLCYHDFGVLSPNYKVYENYAISTNFNELISDDNSNSINNVKLSVRNGDKNVLKSGGKPIAEPVTILANCIIESNNMFTVGDVTIQKLDNGKTRYTITLSDAKEKMFVSIFDPPDGKMMMLSGTIKSPSSIIEFELNNTIKNKIKSDGITIMMGYDDNNRGLIYIPKVLVL